VWLNGKQIGANDTIIGTFRYFYFDIEIICNKPNVLAMQIFPPRNLVFPSPSHDIDLAISFIDWSIYPPDHNMGLWREVLLYIAEDESVPLVLITDPAVNVTVPSESQPSTLPITLLFDVSNSEDRIIKGVVKAELTIEISDSARFPHNDDSDLKIIPTTMTVTVTSSELTLSPFAKHSVRFSPNQFPQLNITFNNHATLKAALWWPWQMGTATMHSLRLTFIPEAGSPLESYRTCVGLRQVTDSLTPKQHRLYYVNGYPILIRGAGWSPELFQRHIMDRQWLYSHLSYVKNMNNNAVRLEGKFESDVFFDLCDELGLLVLPGLACCDAWQHWKDWTHETMIVAQASVQDQMIRLRRHPSMLVFLYSSDELPPENVEKMYLSVAESSGWNTVALTLSSASDVISAITGPTGVKMRYDHYSSFAAVSFC